MKLKGEETKRWFWDSIKVIECQIVRGEYKLSATSFNYK